MYMAIAQDVKVIVRYLQYFKELNKITGYKITKIIAIVSLILVNFTADMICS